MQALGGAKNHAIVLPDADLDFAADHLVAAAFGSAGRALHGDLGGGRGRRRRRRAGRRRSARRPARSRSAPAATPAARWARSSPPRRSDRIVGLIGTGAAAGRQARRRRPRPASCPGYEDGFFVGPTVIDQVTTEMDVYREEIFGPVLSVLRADAVDEAIALINANPYGNGTAIFTASGEAARRFQRGVKVGMIGVNVPIPVPMAYYSFGGWKDSLFGDKPHPRPRGRRVLHPRQGRHRPLAARRARLRTPAPLPDGSPSE